MGLYAATFTTAAVALCTTDASVLFDDVWKLLRQAF